ncbi:hypothetical protein [Lentilactobacillus sp. Marseille-Q4993]|uniref:hypothetical protein n=1 Tax=Lentilactobacillus sp. Marseille-Q4993 TaxID=3039492 RepID=UPI0024BD2AAD|nr:hypothetical protein [Lentilactobacillus sp. Marseille-Q4993]
MKGNFLFINTNPIANMIMSSGITAADFMNGLEELPDNVILLDGNRNAANGYNSHSRFELLRGSGDLRRYLLRDPHTEKKIIDFASEESLNSLTAYEIAELLYLGHMQTPMSSRPFSSKLLNRYIYLTDGDGLLRTYYRRFSEFNHILEIAIKRKLREIHNSRRVFLRPLAIKDIDNAMLIDLITRANDGLFIVFDSVSEKHKKYPIPLRMLNNPEQLSAVIKTSRLMENTHPVGELTYDLAKSDWELEWDE